MTTTVNIHEAKTHFSQLLQRVLEGEEVVIAKAGKPIAILSPAPSATARRIPGNDAGKVIITSAFDGLTSYESAPGHAHVSIVEHGRSPALSQSARADCRWPQRQIRRLPDTMSTQSGRRSLVETP